MGLDDGIVQKRITLVRISPAIKAMIEEAERGIMFVLLFAGLSFKVAEEPFYFFDVEF